VRPPKITQALLQKKRNGIAKMSSNTLTTSNEKWIGTAISRDVDSVDGQAAAGVGWFSLALGAAEVAVPNAMNRLVGASMNPQIMRLLGVREILSGVGILASHRSTGWLWGRVAGDIMDLAVLGSAPLHTDKDARSKRIAAIGAVAGVTVLDAALGVRQMAKERPRRPRERLLHFLSDMYSVEQQALSQLVKAPDIAGDPMIASAFRQHYFETEHQSDLVYERLTALGGSPSTIKNAIMRLGGKGFLAFARAMPETPGRLVVHAYAYEAMEWAGYEILIRFAQQAGDEATVQAAETIRDEEHEMMKRLEKGFDAAEHVTHAGLSQEELTEHLEMHLNEVHSFESQCIELLTKARDDAKQLTLQILYDQLLDNTTIHADRIELRLEALGTRRSIVKDSAMAIGGWNWSLFFQVQADATPKFAGFIYAVLHLQIGAYEMLQRTARRTSDEVTHSLCSGIINEKRMLAQRLANEFDVAAEPVSA
jgi:ferritin-like metal-binding protein YciE